MYYVLKDKKPVAVKAVLEWAQWFETADRQVARTDLDQPGKHTISVSTVFLGLDSGFNFADSQPLLWETMVFGDIEALDGEQTRCAGSWEQAEAMHEEMVSLVRAYLEAPEPE